MSTIRATNAAGLTGTATNLMSGLAKAAGYETGTGTTLSNEFNVSSLTDTGTGDTDFNYANSLSSSHEPANAKGAFGNAWTNGAAQWVLYANINHAITSKIRITTAYAGTATNTTLNDYAKAFVAHGDLA